MTAETDEMNYTTSVPKDSLTHKPQTTKGAQWHAVKIAGGKAADKTPPRVEPYQLCMQLAALDNRIMTMTVE